MAFLSVSSVSPSAPASAENTRGLTVEGGREGRGREGRKREEGGGGGGGKRRGREDRCLPLNRLFWLTASNQFRSMSSTSY